MVNELHASLLSPTELSTTATRMHGLVASANLNEPFVQNLNNTVESDNTDLETALGRYRFSDFTPMMLEKDKVRDDAYIALRDYVTACSRRQDPVVVAAANILVNIFRNRGWTLYNLGYTQESTTLKLLFNDLETPEATAALKTLNAEGWYNDVKTTQAAFEEVFNQKITAEARENYPQLHQAKNRLAQHLTTLMSCIGVLEEQQPDNQKITELVEQLNQVTTGVMTTARARRTRNENNQEIETEVK
jgi:hypothetical protein